MKISTKGRYGLEAIVDLAIHFSEGHVSINSISERLGVSEAYILQIFLTLRRAGIIDSARGAQGGYALARDPSDITAGDVLITLEGPLAPVPCIVESTAFSCDRFETCTTKSLWEDVMNTLTSVAHSITIADLVTCYNNDLLDRVELDYYI